MIKYTREEIADYIEYVSDHEETQYGDIFVGYQAEPTTNLLWTCALPREEIFKEMKNPDRKAWVDKTKFYDMFFVKTLEEMPMHINDLEIGHIAKWRLKIAK